MSKQLISDEDFASVQEAQAGITKLFRKAKNKKKFVRIMRNQEPLGVLIPNDMWINLVEDLEALSSSQYQSDIQKSRLDKKRISSDEIKEVLEYEKD
ncbi:MAG: hypothetical protein PVJ52_00200 [Candidatus Woesebacteria bacterium]|jgi:PHD/YefM family antitoxin component YafN of YafNO toxin-antitoxin module